MTSTNLAGRREPKHSVVVRHAVEGDRNSPGVNALLEAEPGYRAAFESGLNAHFASPHACVVMVAEREGSAVGFATARMAARGKAKVCSSVVLPGHRRRGVGTEFVRSCLQHAAGNWRACEVYVQLLQRERGRRAFESLGFKAISRERMPGCNMVFEVCRE